MTYTPSKPDGGPSPALDVTTIQTNFSQFQSVFSENHTAINNRNQGKHEAIIFALQTDDPGVTTDITSWYAKNAAAATGGPQPQLFIQIPKFLPTPPIQRDIPNTGMQITYNQVNTAGPQYQSFLPGGYLLFMGKISGTTGSPNTKISTTVTLSVIPTKILVAIATANNIVNIGNPVPFTVTTNIVTSSTFTINSTSNPGSSIAYSFQWFAIAQA